MLHQQRKDFSNRVFDILLFGKRIEPGHIFHQTNNPSQFDIQLRYRNFQGFLAARWDRNRKLGVIPLYIQRFDHKFCSNMGRYIRVRHKPLRMDNPGLLDIRLKGRIGYEIKAKRLATHYI